MIFDRILPHIEWDGMAITFDMATLDRAAIIAALGTPQGFMGGRLSGFEWWTWHLLSGENEDIPSWWWAPTRSVVSHTVHTVKQGRRVTLGLSRGNSGVPCLYMDRT